jgi:hypothetical protein
VVIYHADNQSRGGMRFVDVWGVSRRELEKLPGISTVIGETMWQSLTVMVDISRTKDVVSEIISRYGAVELADAVQKSS